MTEREVCPADMSQIKYFSSRFPPNLPLHRWVIERVIEVHVGVGDTIVTDVIIVCLECGERRNLVCTTPISSLRYLHGDSHLSFYKSEEDE